MIGDSHTVRYKYKDIETMGSMNKTSSIEWTAFSCYCNYECRDVETLTYINRNYFAKKNTQSLLQRLSVDPTPRYPSERLRELL